MLAGLLAVSVMLVVREPLPDESRPASVAQTSRIFAADGSLLTTLHGAINRKPVALQDLPTHVSEAVIASEDARFFEHHGIDLRAIARAAMADLMSGAPVQGGSTITQQYVKTTYVGSERTLWRKVREARIAYQLEQRLSKKQILERYLNMVYFGRGAYGIQAAAEAYFGKPASELTVSESALLVGLIPAPARYGPDADPAAAEHRRQAVVGRMQDIGFLARAEAAQARADIPMVAPLNLDKPVRHGWFVDAVRRYLFARYGVEKVLTGGLEVRTTLDPAVQQAAEASIAQALPDPADPYAALVAVEPATGYVRALVGGRDWGTEQFNLAIQARRQPGSAFKPLVLVAALENGIPAAKTYPAPGSVCLDAWKPACRVSNFGRRGFGRITLETATIHSVNTFYAQLILDVGPSRVVDAARRMGVPGPSWLLPGRSGCRPAGTETCAPGLRPLPALALGAQEVTPLEMASAYATLAAGGTYREPKLVEEVVDRSGRVLERGPARGRQAISAHDAAEATRILEGVVSRGTGRRADIGDGVAGKTGTTQDHRDAWFVGYTRDVAAAVWVGHRDTTHPLGNVHGVRRVTGGTIPAGIWADFMQASDVAVLQVEPASQGLVGQELRYRLRVTNAGPWVASNVQLTDEVPATTKFVSATSSAGACTRRTRTVSCRMDPLEAGEQALVEVVVRPREAGTFEHTTTVVTKGTDARPGNNALSREILVAPAADLSVEARGPRASSLAGEEVTFRLTARNEDPSDASAVVLAASLPAGSALASATPEHGTCGREGDDVVCRIGDVRAGRRVRAELVFVAGVAGEAASTVRASAMETDLDTRNNQAEAYALVEPAADLGVRVDGLREEVLAGASLTYRLLVSNAGPSPATTVEVAADVPSRLGVASISPAQGSCSQLRTGFSCNLGELSAGTTTTIDLTGSPTDEGKARLSAQVEANETDPARDDNRGAVHTTVVPVADLGIGSIKGPGAIAVGEYVAYELEVTNHGPSRAKRVIVTFATPPALRLAGASGAGRCRSSRGRVRCTSRTLDLGSTRRMRLGFESYAQAMVEVEVAAGAPEIDPNPDNNRTSVTTSIVRPAGGSLQARCRPSTAGCSVRGVTVGAVAERSPGRYRR